MVANVHRLNIERIYLYICFPYPYDFDQSYCKRVRFGVYDWKGIFFFFAYACLLHIFIVECIHMEKEKSEIGDGEGYRCHGHLLNC
jgi:hypothetical protein